MSQNIKVGLRTSISPCSDLWWIFCFQIRSFSTLNATISCGEFQIPVTNFLLETSLPWIRFTDRENWNFDQALFIVLFILVMAGSRYKTNCDFETAILHYIGGVGRKYILVLGSVASRLRPIRDYIFSQLAANIMRYCRLKIAISLY